MNLESGPAKVRWQLRLIAVAVTLAFTLVAGSTYGVWVAPAGASSTTAVTQGTPPTTFSTIYTTNDDGEPQGTTVTSYPSINTGGGWTGTIGVHPESTVSSDGGTLKMPSGLAFNAVGDLWVANAATDTLVEYTPDQLSSGGPRRPVRTLDSSGLASPEGIAFDTAGDLSVANFDGGDRIVEFTAHELAIAGTEKPAVILKGPAFDRPAGLAFDHAGDCGSPIVEATTEGPSSSSQVAPLAPGAGSGRP